MQGPSNHGRSSRHRAAEPGAAGLTLLFRAGHRVGSDAIASPGRAWTLTHRLASESDAAEVMMAGLRYDLFGLAPGPAARAPAPRHAFDLMLPTLTRTEAVRVLSAEPATVAASRAVLRMQVALGCELAALPGVVGLGWEAAGSVMSPAYYLRVMRAWLEGGAFPGLGLTGLVRDAYALRSEGLTLFIGHEIAVALAAGGSPAGTAKLALRAMHALVEDGVRPEGLADRLGAARLTCAFSADGGLLTIG